MKRMQVGWTATLLWRRLVQPHFLGRPRMSVSLKGTLKYFAKPFLIGSADSVATWCATCKSSLFWADAASRFLRLCTAATLRFPKATWYPLGRSWIERGVGVLPREVDKP